MTESRKRKVIAFLAICGAALLVASLRWPELAGWIAGPALIVAFLVSWWFEV